MPEDQIEQFKLESTNHLYQLLADMDEILLFSFSSYISNFYVWIEDLGVIKDAEDLEDGIDDFHSEFEDTMVPLIRRNSRKLLKIYEKYSEGTTEKQEEKPFFESAYSPRRKNHFVLSKDDFLDIEKFKERTRDFKMREDESAAQTNYHKSYEDLCPKIETYNDIIEKYGYDYIINMNKRILGLSNDVIDIMAEKLKNNEEPDEVVGTLQDLGENIYDGHLDEFSELEKGVRTDIGEHLSNSKQNK